MAQLVERQAVNLQVAGSSPAGGDNFTFYKFVGGLAALFALWF